MSPNLVNFTQKVYKLASHYDPPQKKNPETWVKLVVKCWQLPAGVLRSTSAWLWHEKINESGWMTSLDWTWVTDCSCKLSPSDRQAVLRATTESDVYLHWKYCIRIEMHMSFRGASPPGPPPGALHFAQVLLDQWAPNSFAHGHPRAKLCHC